MWKWIICSIALACMAHAGGLRPAYAAAVSEVDLEAFAAHLRNESENALAEVPFTGFFRLCAAGTLAEVKAALAAGQDPNARDESHAGMPAMTVAAVNNPDAGVVVALLEAGAEVDAVGEVYGRSALHMAVLFDPRHDVINALLNGGADPHLLDRSKESPIDYALKGRISGDFFVGPPDNVLIIMLLNADLRRAARDPRAKGAPSYYTWLLKKYREAFTPRYADTPYPDKQVEQLFRALGATSDESDEAHKERLREAARDLRLDVVEGLLTPEMVASALDDAGNGVLHYIMRGARGGKAQDFAGVLSYALAKGADPAARNEAGETPLHAFARWARVSDAEEESRLLPVVRAFVDHGADMEARDEHGRTPIFGVAATLGLPVHTLGVMRALGCDVNARDGRGMTLLIHAGYSFRDLTDNEAKEFKGNFLIANFTALLDAGADPLLRDGEGKTAMEYLSPAAARHLVDNGLGPRLMGADREL